MDGIAWYDERTGEWRHDRLGDWGDKPRPRAVGGFDKDTTGMPPDLRIIEVVSEPDSADDGAVEDHLNEELQEILLCPDCDMELSAPSCGAGHAYLADHPMEHRLLKPVLERYLRAVRWEEGRVCVLCTNRSDDAKDAVLLATGSCPHIDVRADQVAMSRIEFNRLTEELNEMRGRIEELELEPEDDEDARRKGLPEW